MGPSEGPERRPPWVRGPRARGQKGRDPGTEATPRGHGGGRGGVALGHGRQTGVQNGGGPPAPLPPASAAPAHPVCVLCFCALCETPPAPSGEVPCHLRESVRAARRPGRGGCLQLQVPLWPVTAAPGNQARWKQGTQGRPPAWRWPQRRVQEPVRLEEWHTAKWPPGPCQAGPRDWWVIPNTRDQPG